MAWVMLLWLVGNNLKFNGSCGTACLECPFLFYLSKYGWLQLVLMFPRKASQSWGTSQAFEERIWHLFFYLLLSRYHKIERNWEYWPEEESVRKRNFDRSHLSEGRDLFSWFQENSANERKLQEVYFTPTWLVPQSSVVSTELSASGEGTPPIQIRWSRQRGDITRT